MIRTAKIFLMFIVLAGFASAASLKLQDLPAPVRKTVQNTLKGGEIKNLSKETEKGVTQYEVESLLSGKHRDFNVDSKGGLVVLEEEVSIDSIPAPAKAAILKRVGTGKKSAVLVKADGTETKD